jgi:tetratricopeptide (TPR) repeat protein
MKIRTWILLAGFSSLISAVYAQKGVDTGTRFGSGTDSVNCIKNVSLFTSYAKTNNFKDALEFWKLAYDECPAATKDIYLHGVRIVGWQIDSETDPAKKTALLNDLMTVYDKRIKYFGDDPRYGKDWIIGRKVLDYFQRMGENADPKQMYAWTKEAVDEYQEKTDVLAISYYLMSSNQIMLADQSHRETYIQDYLKIAAIVDKQIAAATDEKEKESLLTTKAAFDNGFANSGAADCETLQNIYASKVEQNKENLEVLKETISLLRRMRCNEIEAYFSAATYAHKLAPTAESARGLARKAIRDKDYAAAVPLFEEAAEMEADAIVKAEDYYVIAAMLNDQKNYGRSRQYCQKAIDANPNYGSPYLLIGQMYAATAASIYPDDPVLRKTVFYAAVDKFAKAKQVDPTVADDANKLINTYSNYFPSSEEVFMHPDLDKGSGITVGGWIGERTTVR